MPTKVTDAQQRMDGGINTVSDDLSMGQSQVRRAENCRLTTYGALTLRPGSLLLTTFANSVTNGFTWYRDAGGIAVLLADSAGALQTADGTDLPAGFTTITGALATIVPPVFEKFVHDGSTEAVYIADGAAVKRTDNATITSTGSIALSFVKVHNQRLWGVGNTTYRQSLFYSALNDGSTIGDTGNGGGQIIIRTFGDEAVVALASVGSSLLIFHRRGLSRLTGFGQDDISVEPEGLSAEISLLSPYSLVELDGACYFLTNRGLYVVTERGVRQVATPEQPDPVAAALQSPASVGSNIGNQCRMVHNPATQELLCFVPGVGCYVYHLVLNAWVGPWTGEWSRITTMVPVSAANISSQAGAGLTRVVLAGSDLRVSLAETPVAKRDQMTDLADPLSGSAIEAIVRFRRMFFGDDALAKTFRWAYLTATLPGSASMDVSWETGTQAGSFTVTAPSGGVWGPGVWGDGVWGNAGSRNYRVPLGGNGYYLDVTLGYAGFGVPIISRAAFEGYALGRR